MANLKGSENPFPHVLMEEVATDGSATGTPAADFRHLFLGEDGALHLKDSAAAVTDVGGGASAAEDVTFTPAAGIAATDVQAAIEEDAGDLTAHLADAADAHDASAVSIADAGTYFTGTDVEAALQELAASAGGISYPLPEEADHASAFSSGTTSLAVTVVSAAIGDNLLMIVSSTGRGANSITQTNVTWTQRYTGNGNSQWLEVWTGVVAGGASGTTATIAFTGSNKAQGVYVRFVGITNFTAASALNTSTSAGTTLLTVLSGGATAGDYVICASSCNAPTSGYGGVNLPANVTTVDAFGGQGRHMLVRPGANKVISYWSISASSVATFMALVKVS